MIVGLSGLPAEVDADHRPHRFGMTVFFAGKKHNPSGRTHGGGDTNFRDATVERLCVQDLARFANADSHVDVHTQATPQFLRLRPRYLHRPGRNDGGASGGP